MKKAFSLMLCLTLLMATFLSAFTVSAYSFDTNNDETVDIRDFVHLKKEIVQNASDERETVPAGISGYAITGTWVRDREGSSSLGPLLTYDGNLSKSWQPQATNYESDEGIVWKLNDIYDISTITLTFGTRKYYFDCSLSLDGKNFITIASITEDNADEYFEGLVCTIDDFYATGAQYVKVTFTGNEGDLNTYITLYETAITGKICTASTSDVNGDYAVDTNDLILMRKQLLGIQFTEEVETDEREIVSASITNYKTVGSWTSDRIGDSTIGPEKSYDGNSSTMWNPQANGWLTEDGIVYVLDNTYDLTSAVLTFGSRIYYFNVFVSEDGYKYNRVATVNPTNSADYYEGYVATIDNLDASSARYVKVTFTGAASTFIALYEVNLSGRVTVDEREEASVVVTGHSLEGKWANSREGTSASAARTYDGDVSTNWNPAVSNFTSSPAIVYTLDKNYNLTSAVLTFGSRQHYFDLAVSANGTDYYKIASVTSANAADYFDGYVCTIDGINSPSARFVKVTFTGTPNATTWLNMMEAEFEGKAAADNRAAVSVTINDNTITGTWVKSHEGSSSVGPQLSYDGDDATCWNPQATNYKSDEAITFTLNNTYNLNQAAMNFKTRPYYFDMYVSTDGESFTKVISVNSSNASDYYDENNVCTLTGLNSVPASYVKLAFTGCSTGSTFISLYEITAEGKFVN